MDQNGISEMDSNINGELIFDKGAKIIQWGKVLSFWTSGAWHNWICTYLKNEPQPLPRTSHKNELKMDYKIKYKS